MDRKQKKSIFKALRVSRSFLLLICILIAIVVVFGTTWAWFVAEDMVGNRFETDQYVFDVDLVDEFTDPGLALDPGESASKKVAAVNTGELTGFVRVMILPTIVAADGKTLLPAEIGQQVTLNVDTGASAKWLYGGDGYYYYTEALGPGKQAGYLFTEAGISSSLMSDDRYKNAKLNIEVKCESVGAQGWDYRISWWGSIQAPDPASPLFAIDDKLKEFVR